MVCAFAYLNDSDLCTETESNIHTYTLHYEVIQITHTDTHICIYKTYKDKYKFQTFHAVNYTTTKSPSTGEVLPLKIKRCGYTFD